MIYKQAGAADKELPVISATCEKKEPRPPGRQRPVRAPRAAAAGTGGRASLGHPEVPLCSVSRQEGSCELQVVNIGKE